MHITENEQGLSLVELAIVMVIIGLLAAGIMGGSHIMHTSQLQQVVTEADRYKMAIRTFEQKYGALPGDFDTAFDLWGTAGGCTNNDVNSDSTGCNGNGDGVFSIIEGYRGWQQLGLSEILTEDYSGTAPGGTGVIGTNIPESALEGGGYTLLYKTVEDTGLPPILCIVLGTFFDTNWAGTELLTPADAMAIDQKADDGYPDSGEVYGEDDWTTDGCYSGTYPNMEYDTTQEAARCRSIFKL
ncbi:MAG: pilus assembly protein [Alphaproteobacteria bacterium]|nr:pilus assembly protein [Alphaproteobacteria bacterium]